MLRRKQGATVGEIVKAFGWQPHTVRGAFAGALKKKLGLTIVSEMDERRGRISPYRRLTAPTDRWSSRVTPGCPFSGTECGRGTLRMIGVGDHRFGCGPAGALPVDSSPIGSSGSGSPPRSNSVGSEGEGVAIRLRLAGVNPNSAAIRIMISAWRLAIATYGDCISRRSSTGYRSCLRRSALSVFRKGRTLSLFWSMPSLVAGQPALAHWSVYEAPAHDVQPSAPIESIGRGRRDPHGRSGITFEPCRATEHQHSDRDASDRRSDCRGSGGI